MRVPAAAGARQLLYATSGLIVWAVAFVVLYAGLSIGCRTGLPDARLMGVNMLSIVLALLWIAHLVPLAILQVRHWRRSRAAVSQPPGTPRFLAAAACLVTAAGLFGTVYVGFAILLLPPCA